MLSTQTRSAIAGVPVRELANKFGTPLFVYDAKVIKQQVANFAAFDVIRYAQKANSNLAVLRLMRKLGVVLDAVSAGEVLRALKAGFEPRSDPPQIVYTADIFDREALDVVVKHQVHVNCGSRDMLDQLAQHAGGQQITLRINPGFGHGHSQKTNTGGEQSKHGIWHEELEATLAQTKDLGHTVTGLHLHIGSGNDLEHLAQVCVAMKDLALRVGASLLAISAGGGISIPYRSEQQPVDTAAYFELWNGTRRELEGEFGHPVKLEIEPGRYLVAEAGFLIAEIRAVKRMGNNTFYLVDAGFNNLARPILYGAYHPMSIDAADPQDGTQPVIVGGPLCESGDIFTQEEGGFVSQRDLPLARVGDYLIIECAGAYSSVMGSNYNSKPLAAEAMIDTEGVTLIRRRQTFEQMVQDESTDS
ncbi:MAG: diaminopimelate decarboxylase [Pirellulales bacterium]|nr:diaminopimelate decarboxylase [Pirellulales bacterium]